MAFLHAWRRTFASKNGPPDPATRHVLHALSLYMNADGGSCYPSIETISADTAMNERTVRRHLQRAADLGWIVRSLRGGTGQAWKLYSYQAAIPKGADFVPVPLEEAPGEIPAPLTEGPGIDDSKHRTLATEGPGIDDTTSGRDARLSIQELSITSPVELKDMERPVGRVCKTTYPPEFEETWKEYPKREGGNGKKSALKAWKARLATGHSVADMHAGVIRYAAYCDAKGWAGTAYVKQAASFFGPEDPPHFLNDWKATQQPATQSRAQRVNDKLREIAQRGFSNERFDDIDYTAGIPAKPSWAE